jgi:hypothetical protein
MYDVN